MSDNYSETSFINQHFSDWQYSSAFTKQGYAQLRSYMGKVEAGQPKVYEAPFAKGVDIQKVLEEWNEVLISIQDKWPSLYAFENDLRSKVGPMSVQLPLKDRISDIAHYYADIRKSADPLGTQAILDTKEEFAGLRGLRLRSQERVWELMKKSTNSGAPFFTKRRYVHKETLPCASWFVGGNRPSVYANLNNGMTKEVPAVIGWRGQEGGPTEEDVKQRVVWMFPMAVNINELQVYQPFIEGAQSLNLVPAWVSMESVDKRITELFRSKGRDDLVVCTDFTRFDQHFNQELQDVARSVLLFVFGRGNKPAYGWLRNVFPIKYCIPMLWDADVNKHGGVNDISVFVGWHGMASGSGGTNVDETIAHRALQYDAAYLNNSKLNPNSQCLGDDGVLSYPGITVEDVVKAYQSHGLDCNPSKQYASTQDCVYLRRWHHEDYMENGICVGVYSTMRAIGRLRYLERFMDPEYWSEKMVALRQLSILENIKYHPLKEQFVQFCMKRDSYRLGLDIPGFLDELPKYTAEAIDHMPDFLGYTKTLQGWSPSGITNWWIVKYLKSLK